MLCRSLPDGVLVVTAEFFDRMGVGGTSQVRTRVVY